VQSLDLYFTYHEEYSETSRMAIGSIFRDKLVDVPIMGVAIDLYCDKHRDPKFVDSRMPSVEGGLFNFVLEFL
jgi:hypothetical protein